ncbi:MAG TPA: alpha/beta fold hydrolase [Bryobacteraceae bacterium]|nr:alpha/beta fold hydrolase [Bryobacteraceae bacterium]
MPRRIESLFVDGPVGRLEALLEEPEEGEPREAALVCHPHPQHGGTMHNKVVYRIARGLRRAGAVVLRFNFRGVNQSAGSYGEGEGELDDARAALKYLRERYPDLPYTLAGFSFGSRVALRLGCENGNARRTIAVGFPTRYHHTSNLEHCLGPRIFIQSTNDEFGPLEELRPFVESLAEPKKLIVVPAQDHFFVGGLDKLEEEIAGLGVGQA